MKPPDLIPLVEKLGRAFAGRGMEEHARRLRVYYLALKHGLADGRGELDVRWGEQLVIDWMKTLQLPPYERALPSLPRGSRCPSCQDGRVGDLKTEMNFPGGARMRCAVCGTSWIERG